MRIAYKVTITEVATGESVEVDDGFDWGDLNSFKDWWQFGNGDCDCNRRIHFERAKGNDPDDIECGDGRYAVSNFKREEIDE